MSCKERISYQNLLLKYQKQDQIPYGELLNTIEWKEFRDKITKRDYQKCRMCGKSWTFRIDGNECWIDDSFYDPPRIYHSKKAYYLNAHHKYYIIGKLPWEYPEEDVITLCNWCHWDFHQNNEITVYDENNIPMNALTPCYRCNGAGWFPEYRHVDAGICFRCRGAKYEELMHFKIH